MFVPVLSGPRPHPHPPVPPVLTPRDRPRRTTTPSRRWEHPVSLHPCAPLSCSKCFRFCFSSVFLNVPSPVDCWGSANLNLTHFHFVFSPRSLSFKSEDCLHIAYLLLTRILFLSTGSTMWWPSDGSDVSKEKKLIYFSANLIVITFHTCAHRYIILVSHWSNVALPQASLTFLQSWSHFLCIYILALMEYSAKLF